MRTRLILLVVLLAPFCADAEDLRDRLLASPLMTSEQCSRMSPTSLCDELVRSGQFGPIGLVQEDIIHQVYEERLAPVADKKYPKAATLRPHMTAALRIFNLFIAEIHHGGGTGIGHWERRIPAHLEWQMHCGSRDEFADASNAPGYSLGDMTNTAIVLFKAQFHIQGPEDEPQGERQKRIMHLLDESLEHWRKAEGLMTPAEIICFRNVFMKVVATSL